MIGIARGFPIYGNKWSAGDLDNRSLEAMVDPLSDGSDLGPRPNRGRPRGALPRAGDFRHARWDGGRDDRPRRRGRHRSRGQPQDKCRARRPPRYIEPNARCFAGSPVDHIPGWAAGLCQQRVQPTFPRTGCIAAGSDRASSMPGWRIRGAIAATARPDGRGGPSNRDSHVEQGAEWYFGPLQDFGRSACRTPGIQSLGGREHH
jgi:hypothetical protein